jgi:hypothetical protein
MTFTGAIGALTLLFNKMRRRERLRRFYAIPYAPYIVLGIATQMYLPNLIGEFMLRFR